jgi:hypothetical protein
MLLIIFLGLITKLALVLGDNEVATTNPNNLDWTKVCISVDRLNVTSRF